MLIFPAFLSQSAERWRCLGTDAGLHNFDLHAFRAVFQMVYVVVKLLSLFCLLLFTIMKRFREKKNYGAPSIFVMLDNYSTKDRYY